MGGVYQSVGDGDAQNRRSPPASKFQARKSINRKGGELAGGVRDATAEPHGFPEFLPRSRGENIRDLYHLETFCPRCRIIL